MERRVDCAHGKGRTFEQFWNSLQGMAGQSLILATPYPYKTAEEQWQSWRTAANGGRGPANQPAQPQDWSGQWAGGSAGNVLLRDYLRARVEELQAALRDVDPGGDRRTPLVAGR